MAYLAYNPPEARPRGVGMQIAITGRHVSVNESFRDQVSQRLETSAGKFYSTAIDAQAVFAKVAQMIETDLMIHVGHGIRFQSHAAAADMTASFSIAAERLEKRMRRHKRKLRDHHKSPRGAKAVDEAEPFPQSAD